jgi:hypothetical protein
LIVWVKHTRKCQIQTTYTKNDKLLQGRLYDAVAKRRTRDMTLNLSFNGLQTHYSLLSFAW